MPSLTAPRDYQSPGGTDASWAGLNKLIIGYPILGKSGFGPVLPRPYNRPGLSGQAQAWPNRSPTSIVQDTSTRAEIRHLFSGLWCTKDDPLDQSSICLHIVGNGCSAELQGAQCAQGCPLRLRRDAGVVQRTAASVRGLRRTRETIMASRSITQGNQEHLLAARRRRRSRWGGAVGRRRWGMHGSGGKERNQNRC